MLRVFLITSDLTPVPLTVIAAHDAAAGEIFATWATHHHPGQQVADPKIRLLSADDLAVQPQLADAVAQGAAGVTYWCGHRLGFLVAAPQEVQFGSLAPSEPMVRCYAAGDDAEEVLVFARNVDEAIGLFTVWNATANGFREGPESMLEMTRWLLRGPQVILREDMDAGLTGVGRVCEDGFWRVFPADYEAPLTR
jgi:hypothetical protein